jgi:hypothetical protein
LPARSRRQPNFWWPSLGDVQFAAQIVDHYLKLPRAIGGQLSEFWRSGGH